MMKLNDRNPRLAAIRTLLLAEMAAIEAKQHRYMNLGFGTVEATPEQIAMLKDQMEQGAQCREALGAFDRLGV